MSAEAHSKAMQYSDAFAIHSANYGTFLSTGLSTGSYQAFSRAAEPVCPPCFNCLLPTFECKQFAKCNPFNGMCDCPAGFGGNDCGEPVCGSLADGADRHIRQGPSCNCSEGWSGINCNVCETDSACDSLMPGHVNGTCYKGGLVVHENFQMCDVTNRKIGDQLKDKKPQVTFSCQAANETCEFQFWVDEQESFYCGLDACKFSQSYSGSQLSTKYECENIECKCFPGRMLCGEDGSIDISDFLSEEIKGPGSFVCSAAENGCRFEEPAMNGLISDVFGDPSITLDCKASECLHYSDVPGYSPPKKPAQSGIIAFSVTSAVILFIFLTIGIFLAIRRNRKNSGLSGFTRLPDEEEDTKLLVNHAPATLSFRHVTYEVKGQHILDNVSGLVESGQVLAIIGASGAGKTSLLDLLARKNKSGSITGEFLVNGRVVKNAEYKEVVGFVDQEDALVSTLTVYETILYSALLRLPADMSFETKNLRVLETMIELGISHIKDSMIGQEGNRGISGGEKRRVSIACELVTSPSILFLDEPTSGLDSYNAFNVAEALARLAKSSNRTIVMTIHQPRSNIVALFDQLILLGHGQVVYSGAMSSCQSYFDSIGHGCPSGYNIVDHLIDLTMSVLDGEQSHMISTDSDALERDPQVHSASGGEVSHSLARCHSIRDDAVDAWRTTESFDAATSLPRATRFTFRQLVGAFTSSEVMAAEDRQIDSMISAAHEHPQDAHRPLVLGFRRLGWYQQFLLLSARTFKNQYRNPALLLTHYGIAVTLAFISGYLFFDISNDLSGFQGRLGLFFFILALFGFSTLTSLNLFAAERIIFLRERANGYYSTFTYFLAKVIFDVIPLRVFPPLVMGIIVYPMVGLVPELPVFGRFLLILVLFNMAAASVCLFLGIVIRETNVANLIGSLFMLFSLLFAGLLLNHDKIPNGLQWLQRLSIFHYAYEALLVNEVTYLTLTEKKFGLSIEVPGATILSSFGFNARAMQQDIFGLAIYFAVFLTLSYMAMHFLLVERR